MMLGNRWRARFAEAATRSRTGCADTHSPELATRDPLHQTRREGGLPIVFYSPSFRDTRKTIRAVLWKWRRMMARRRRLTLAVIALLAILAVIPQQAAAANLVPFFARTTETPT